MLYRVIDADEVPALVSAFLESYEVVAPVDHGQITTFDVITSPDQISESAEGTQSSLKKYFLPPMETLFKFDTVSNKITDYQMELRPRVIFGAHACDINALNRLDLVFRFGKYPDPYYIARRQATLIIGVGCMPTKECFCNLWDSDEAHFGYDLFLQNLNNGHVLVSISSVEAANILEATCDLRVASDEDRIAFRQRTRNRQNAFSRGIPDIQEVAMLMDVFHKDEYWEQLGGTCLSCSACAAVCPTCFCFDIRDELDPNGVTGKRERVWDACTSPQFAVVAGGHNFRATTRDRVRHRMYHKLNGFLANH
ncbi:MAG: 4Fe-4S dicluster domain-containing protein, partial [Eggerthellales bacterium]|nr:4Fe-4S dicluster domain-containing protein [Eggerthellales bacterium]